MSLVLYTIGYSGHTVESFREVMDRHRIEYLIDVRENPISRKPGFSWDALLNMQAGCTYVGAPELGVPRNLRVRLKSRELSLPDYLRKYRLHLRRHEWVLEAVFKLLPDRCCLMCAEHDPYDCHRSVIASAVQDCREVRIVHL